MATAALANDSIAIPELHRNTSSSPFLAIHLDSSEETPSDNTSLYNATIIAGGWPVDFATSSEEQSPVRKKTRRYEDKKRASVAVKSCPRRVSSVLPPSIANTSKPSVRNQHRLCLSLDEITLSKFHHQHFGRETSESPSEDSVRSPSPDQTPLRPASAPAEPPFAAPERVLTPEGIPSFPGTRRTLIGQQSASERGSKKGKTALSSVLTRLAQIPRQRLASARQSLYKRTRRQGMPPQRPTNPWRPPVSGHTAYRFGGLETHPFNFATAERIGDPRSMLPEQPSNKAADERMPVQSSQSSRLSRLLSIAPSLLHDLDPRTARHNDTQTGTTATAQPSEPPTVSDSSRALAAASELPLPVSSIRLAAMNARRSSSVPRSRLQSPASTMRLGSQRRHTWVPGTMNTIDLIQAFPEPPSGIPTLVQPAPQPKTKRLSLFPPFAERGTAAQAELTTLFFHSPLRQAQSTAPCPSPDPEHSAVVPFPPFNENIAPSTWMSGALHNSATEATESSIDDGPPIRGESSSRYRRDGTPIYTPSAASLQSLDRRTSQEESPKPPPIFTPARPHSSALSGRTGMSRYFSAASRVISVPKPLVEATQPTSAPAYNTPPSLTPPSALPHTTFSQPRNPPLLTQLRSTS